MIKRFVLSKQTEPLHDFGRSFKFDFPIEAIEGYVTGFYACPKNVYIFGNFYGEDNTNVGEDILSRNFNSTFGKISVSTDNGDVIHSSVPMSFRPALDNINKLIVPVDYHRVGNKFTVVVEEFLENWMWPNATFIDEEYPDTSYPEVRISYDLEVYVKLTKLASHVTDINRHRERAFC